MSNQLSTALNIDKPGWREYIARLSEVSDTDIHDLDSLKQALSHRIEYFDHNGCRASDHGLDHAVFALYDRAAVDAVVKKGLRGEAVTAEEAADNE